MIEEPIKGCPCCGGHSVIIYDFDKSSKWIECLECGMSSLVYGRDIPEKDMNKPHIHQKYGEWYCIGYIPLVGVFSCIRSSKEEAYDVWYNKALYAAIDEYQASKKPQNQYGKRLRVYTNE